MANEDYNISHYVTDRGTSGMKKEEYWSEGFKKELWRPIKTASSLRNRYRFYVKYLMNDDLKKIERYISRCGPNKIEIGYVNFKSTTENYTSGPKMFFSVLQNPEIILITPEKRRARKVKRVQEAKEMTLRAHMSAQQQQSSKFIHTPTDPRMHQMAPPNQPLPQFRGGQRGMVQRGGRNPYT